MEEFEYKGIWWLPSSPDLKVSGSVYFSAKEGGRLETVGGKILGRRPSLYLPHEEALINGVTISGRKITLYKCETFTPLSENYASFRVYMIFVGTHFEKASDIIFDKFELSFANLREWVLFSNTRTDHQIDEEGNEFFKIEYMTPKKLSYSTEQFDICFEQNAEINYEKTALDISTQLEFTLHDNLVYDKFVNNHLYHLLNFFTLATGGIIQLSKLVGFNNQSTDKISIYHQTRDTELSPPIMPLNSRSLFYLNDVKDNFASYINNWFVKSKSLRPIFNLYFGIVYSPSIYAPIQFLMLMRALEGYHRIMYGQEFMTKAEYKPLKKQILKLIKKCFPGDANKDFRKKISESLSHANEYSLGERLNSIFDEMLVNYKDMVNDIIRHQGSFIKKIKDTRNYLTHPSEEDLTEAVITEREEFIKYIRKLKCILQLCFAVELEIPPEVIKERVIHNPLWHYARQP